MSRSTAGPRRVPPSALLTGTPPAFALRNRQRDRRLHPRRLRPIVAALLHELGITSSDLSVAFLDARAMTRVNETFLRHGGVTDVITFNYQPEAPHPSPTLCGEVLVCVAVAIEQARRYRLSWQAEVVRYLVHGVLHLRGFDDQEPGERRRMKREENRCVHLLAHQFDLQTIGR